MITVRVECSGLNIHVFAENTDKKLIQPLIERFTDKAEKIMREKTPLRTGALRESIQKRVRDKEAVIEPTAPYAVFVEIGTRPHEIRPVHAKVLRFEATGRVIFAMSAYHPGARPQPFIRETADLVLSELPNVFNQVFRGVEK